MSQSVAAVSLYIPCYNAAATLGACIESVLGMTVRPQEIIVVDDGSSDSSAQVCSRYPVTLLRKPGNAGLAAARNAALQQARFPLIAALDADCVAEPHWLSCLLACLERDPRCCAAGGMLVERDTSAAVDLWRAVHMRQHWGDQALQDPQFLFGANTLFRKSALERAGGYDPRFRSNYEDVDICRKLRALGCGSCYEPAARAQHLKKDTLSSLLQTYWQWRKFFYIEQGAYDNDETFRRHLKESAGLANRLICGDLDDGQSALAYIDLLMVCHHALCDLKHYRFADIDPPGSSVDLRLRSWLNLLYIDIAGRGGCSPDKGLLGTGQDRYLRDLIAVALVLGIISVDFPAELSQRVCGDLLRAFTADYDPGLAMAVVTIAAQQGVWRGMLNRESSFFDVAQIGYFLECFDQWFKALRQRYPGLIPALRAASSTIAVS